MIAEPRRSRSRHVRLVGQTEETYTPESNLEAIQKACQGLAPGETQAHEFDGIIAAAAQAGAEKEAVEVAVDYNYLPVRQVSHDQEVIPTPAPQPAAPKTAEAAATGDIQRYRDPQGVLHIGNAPPSQPPPSQPDSPSVVREAMIAEPRRSRSRHVRLVGQTEETYTPESVLDAIQKACQGLARGETQSCEFDGIIAAAAQAAAEKEAAEVALDYNYLPLRQVSPDQGVIPAPAPQPAAPKTAEAATAAISSATAMPGAFYTSAMRRREPKTSGRRCRWLKAPIIKAARPGSWASRRRRRPGCPSARPPGARRIPAWRPCRLPPPRPSRRPPASRTSFCTTGTAKG